MECTDFPFAPSAFKDKTVVITGGAGVLAQTMVEALSAWGCKVAILDVNARQGEEFCRRLAAPPARMRFWPTDILQKGQLEKVAAEVIQVFGRVDILINAAGGNRPDATVSADKSFFDLPAEALRFVFDLNCLGTILACQVFGRQMAQQKSGVIVNIASMSAFKPLTRIPAYSAAKAAVSNFTQWLAVAMAQDYAPQIRVNALAPGFFLTDQNRFLLLDKDTGALTPRGQQILAHTPMKRFGQPTDLLGTLGWLISDAAEFVTGIVVPVDGGYAAFGGV